jgi:eukaryotic-like serine/threonine-protein kinase
VSRAFYVNQSVGEYRIVDFLGAGGMGEVYRAEHTKIGRIAAVKVLTQATQSSGFVERFFNEARIQASLQHPNIATLYDFREEQGQPCIIMEYVDGQTISERMAAYGGALPLSETVYVFEKVCEAVEYVHRHGIIHRDIKSNNIKISSRGEVKLLDFGIAKGQTSPGRTQVGSVVGTLLYLAPELIRGGSADQRGDIWALGILLYEMVTGRVPFYAETIGDICDQIKSVRYTAPAQLNPGLPREAVQIISRCLRENPAQRYGSAAELLRDARRLTSAVSKPGVSSTVSEAATEYAEAKEGGGLAKIALFGGAAVFVLLLVAAGLGGLVYMTEPPAEPSANASGLVGQNNRPANYPTRPTPPGEERTIELTTLGGAAEVHRDGVKIGTTPYQIRAKLGERVRLTLKREGHTDEPVDFTVTEKKVYTFDLKK